MKGQKIFAQRTKALKKTYIFQKNGLHKDPIVSVNAILITPPKFSSQSPRLLENLYFFRKILVWLFLKTVL